jgi:hypothetical protein
VEKLRDRDGDLERRIRTLDSMLFLTANGSSPFGEYLPDFFSLSADSYLEQDDSNGISNAWGLGLGDDFLMGWNSKPANSTV